MTDSPEKPAPLPSVIPVFPLPKVILFPGSNLPLNIFEPRYLKMIEDAHASHQVIGMIQPRILEEEGQKAPPLFAVGCAGHISHMVETQDGRYLIRLTGISRFMVEEEMPVTTLYRQVKADWATFEGDTAPLPERGCFDRKVLLDVLKTYLDSRGLAADYDGINAAPDGVLVNTLSMIIPFALQEKQALIEAVTVPDRAETLKSLLIMSAASGKPN